MPLTPPRQLRAAIAHFLPPRLLTPSQEARQALILATAPALFAEFGRDTMKVSTLAAALSISPAAFRSLFLDLDALLGDIIRRHCQTILDVLKSVPTDAPHRVAALCAAYHQATRLPLGNGYTDAHLLLVRDLSILPDDERKPTEAFRTVLGQFIAGPHAESALRLLDDPTLPLPDIHRLIAKLLETAAPEAAPAKPPQPTPRIAPTPRLIATQAKPPKLPPWNRHMRRALAARAGPA